MSYSKEELALVYGTMLGDGCLSKVKRAHLIEICGNYHDDLPFLNKIKVILSNIRRKEVKIKKRVNIGKLEINFCDKKLFHFFKEFGFPVGKKGINLIIPEYFKPHYTEIIQGYFATDGCLVITNNNGILYPRIEFASISKPLLIQVLDFLNNNGMSGKLYVSHKAKNNWKTLYRIQFNGKNNLYKFIQLIGFINPKHQEKYQKWKNGG